MNEAELKNLILELLSSIAPEADYSSLAGDANLRETLDLDSMDFLNFVTALHQRTGKNIPESDYPELITLDKAINYLRR
ncbi:MAG: acyl carrier protein [Dongiaceae bacterium]